jgi:hypothetical protein
MQHVNSPVVTLLLSVLVGAWMGYIIGETLPFILLKLPRIKKRLPKSIDLLSAPKNTLPTFLDYRLTSDQHATISRRLQSE